MCARDACMSIPQVVVITDTPFAIKGFTVGTSEQNKGRRTNQVRCIIAIDGDVSKSGVAFLERQTRRLEVANLTFPCLIDYLQTEAGKAKTYSRPFLMKTWISKLPTLKRN